MRVEKEIEVEIAVGIGAKIGEGIGVSIGGLARWTTLMNLKARLVGQVLVAEPRSLDQISAVG